MKLFLVYVTICFTRHGETELMHNKPDNTEAREMRNKTISNYGFPEDYKKLGLPGAELAVQKNTDQHISKFVGEPGNYTLLIRYRTQHFSYNGRYEDAHLRKVGSQEIPVVKGQFVELFEGKKGGFYIRTIGYTLNEKGYRQFLIDLSAATISVERIPLIPVYVASAKHGGSTKSKVPISPTVLTSLIGGNPLG